MKIYFACSIIGGRRDEGIYQKIVKGLIDGGHQVLTEGLASKDLMELESIVDPNDIYNRDVGWIKESNILIAEVSTPSHGVGYEIGYALNQSIPVICLYRAGTPVSKMILGNRDPNLSIHAYEIIEAALEFVRQRLDEI